MCESRNRKGGAFWKRNKQLLSRESRGKSTLGVVLRDSMSNKSGSILFKRGNSVITFFEGLYRYLFRKGRVLAVLCEGGAQGSWTKDPHGDLRV